MLANAEDAEMDRIELYWTTMYVSITSCCVAGYAVGLKYVCMHQGKKNVLELTRLGKHAGLITGTLFGIHWVRLLMSLLLQLLFSGMRLPSRF